MAAARPRSTPLPPPESWAAHLRVWREAKGLTQTAAAQYLNVPMRTYQDWEGAKAKLTLLSPAQIREILDQGSNSENYAPS